MSNSWENQNSKAWITVNDLASVFASPEARGEWQREGRPEAVEANEAALAGMTVEEYRAYKAAAEQKAAKKAADKKAAEARAKIAEAAAAEKAAEAAPAPAPERPRGGFAGVVQFPRGRASSLEAASSMSPIYIAAIAVVVAGGAYYLFRGKR